MNFTVIGLRLIFWSSLAKNRMRSADIYRISTGLIYNLRALSSSRLAQSSLPSFGFLVQLLIPRSLVRGSAGPKDLLMLKVGTWRSFSINPFLHLLLPLYFFLFISKAKKCSWLNFRTPTAFSWLRIYVHRESRFVCICYIEYVLWHARAASKVQLHEIIHMFLYQLM